MKFREAGRLRVLDFDIENRPLAYLGSDFTTSEITAIAASWVGEKKIHAWLLGPMTGDEILDAFQHVYEQADIVTGHYIIRHDLPIINGARLEHGRPPLAPKLVSDTKDHLRKRSGVSASQQSLSEMLDLVEAKYAMTQGKWRAANRLTPAGVRETRRRVIDDVRQHKEMREALVHAGWLKAPRTWAP